MNLLTMMEQEDPIVPPEQAAPEPEQSRTVEIEIINAEGMAGEVSNDEPIPLQANVIYVDRLSPLLNCGASSSASSESVSREQLIGGVNQQSSEGQMGSIIENGQVQEDPAQKMFPIFYKDHQRTIADAAQELSFHGLFDPARRRVKNRLKASSWRPNGSNQYQIDAGQKEYGAVQCPQCDLMYTVHEPEEELIHQNYHQSLHLLKFAGWTQEPVVATVPEWDVSGRILAVTMAETRQKLQKIQEILSVVDRELGYVEPTQLVMGSVVYLAVARSIVLGICVIQPLQQANRLLTIEGIEGSIDCCTMETYPTKCGVSRIWVSPNYRGHGIARTLLTVMKSHYIFGYPLSYDEIAFSAPTEAGKRLAESVTGRKDFLIYM
ncbi:N-acetyltransferase eco-like [Uranotaenia lowii]|uniref:N-acetyltransferase eco-like n=1 Tax=Uranotaenia lowii TaxID=190385 RepID=UPI0024784125|nr:N-acetyltransferase eco-like [Uranotaenia lowii]